MTVFKKLQHVSAKTKIFLFALLLIILPSGFLGYLGYRSIDSRELRLKDNYTGLVRLFRDQLEANLGTLEEVFIQEIRKYDWPFDVPTIQRQLGQILGENPLIKELYLVDPEGSIIHPEVHLFGPSSLQSQGAAAQAMSSADVSSGERFEYLENNYSQALRSYSSAMERAPSIQVQAYIRMLVARCLFKMENYSQASEHYSRLVEMDRDVTSQDGTPLKIIGLSQLAESYSRLEQDQDQCHTLLILYEELLLSPHGFDSYDFYRQSLEDELNRLSRQPVWDNKYQIQLETLKEEELRLLHTVGVLEASRTTVLGLMDNESSFSREIFEDGEGNSIQIACMALLNSNSQTPQRKLIYQIDQDFVLTNILPEIRNKDDIGRSVRLGIVDEGESVVFPEETPIPSLGLASEKLVEFFPWWSLVIYDTKGKTVEHIIRREKMFYGGALLGVFILILGGAVLTLRAAVHEAELARLKSDFVSNVSHELKTPLALIRLFGETLELEDIQDHKQRKKFSHIITRESQRLSQLVENVLDFSKIDAGRKEYNFEQADIVQVASQTFEAYRYYLKDQGYELATSLPAEPILIRIDKDAISQAILNLVSNAEKFSQETKFIGVKMFQVDHEVRIDVEDKGPGIPESVLGQIFDKFNRGAGEIAREIQGSGLGLTIAKHIIEGHGGRITVESKIGVGSHFIINLPLQRE